jgi:hypothetical protein
MRHKPRNRSRFFLKLDPVFLAYDLKRSGKAARHTHSRIHIIRAELRIDEMESQGDYLSVLQLYSELFTEPRM